MNAPRPMDLIAHRIRGRRQPSFALLSRPKRHRQRHWRQPSRPCPQPSKTPKLEISFSTPVYPGAHNTVRPHDTLAGDRPIERYLADPDAVTTPSLNTAVPNAPTCVTYLTRDMWTARSTRDLKPHKGPHQPSGASRQGRSSRAPRSCLRTQGLQRSRRRDLRS